MDFKGPVPSFTKNKYLLTIVDEYSRFPFAFACSDLSAETVIKFLNQLFAIFGMPSYIHTDRGASFMSSSLKEFLTHRNIATSRTTPYNPEGNGQIERYNGIIWRALTLALKTQDLPIEAWETVLLDALHSVRSLLCTATNCTPHERIFTYHRRSTSGRSIPTWLTTPGSKVLLKKYVI
jgi:transposase InsO family protein